jgi:pimeloyl-ACP methyl ester carboxylesterase
MTTTSPNQAPTAEKVVATWNDRIRLRFAIRGSGPALVYLHPAGGLFWDEFLARLTQHYTVYAPIFPGTSPDDTFAIHELDDIFDVVLAYEQALRSLGLENVPVVGQSFGGMLAAELSACFPKLFSKVALLDPAGLWNEAHPWSLDFISAPPEQLPGLLFKDPAAAGPRSMFPPPSGPEEALEQAVAGIWTFGCMAKFLWPVPDRGLRKRLHRVTAPTLIMWGEDDRLIPVAYAEEFGRLIPHSRVEVVPDCGHIPQVERTDHTYATVMHFLATATPASLSPRAQSERV